jgi:hypothetical protein
MCVNGHHDKCNCHQLTGHYGKSHFQCDFLSCPSHLRGFPTREQLKRHIAHHERQYKCPIEHCDYFVIGFTTEVARDDHRGKCHQQGESGWVDLKDLASRPDEVTLFDLVRVGDAGSVSLIMSNMTSISPAFHVELLQLAISSGSIPTIEALFEGKLNETPAYGLFLLEHAAKAKDMNLLRWRCITEAQSLPEHLKSNGYVLRLGKPFQEVEVDSITSWKKMNTAVITSQSSEIFDIWVETLVARTPALAFQTMAFIDTSEYPEQEARLLALWQSSTVSKSVTNKVISQAFADVAQGCCSLAKGEVLLELGADVNYRSKKNGPTPLQWASRKTTHKGAEFIKFLLMRGADPATSCLSGYARDESGAAGISKWLGVSFDELVEWAKAEGNCDNVP